MNRILVLAVLAVLVTLGLGATAEAQVFRPRSKTGISHPAITPIVASAGVGAAKTPTTTAPATKGTPAIAATATPVAKVATKTATKTPSTTKTAAKKSPRRVVKKKGNGDDDDEVVVVDDDDDE